ncbi:hypothetical protein DENSPDRAFT_767396 [Dentipellis sp. KUC8613]|nr:hypothetical protein DENSPDRAFT_767396 [Dentipellis sp. KUC8613]
MPVPVLTQAKGPAHPVIKNRCHPGDQGHPPSVFHNLTHSLPLPPPGPPPSFGTREEWISSLPSWRRNKPRRIWEEDDANLPPPRVFHRGLTDADNASVIKGERAQACIPPTLTLISQSDRYLYQPSAPHGCEEDVDDEMSSISIDYEIESQWSGNSSDVQEGGVIGNRVLQNPILSHLSAGGVELNNFSEDQQMYERGAFTPIFEEFSPELAVGDGDPASSPIGPLTPFGDFVDRAVETALTRGNIGATSFQSFDPAPDAISCHRSNAGLAPYMQYHPWRQPAPADLVPASEPVAAPSATTTYKRIAEPLADWMASYVWKACTTGMSLPPAYVQSCGSWAQTHPPFPPPQLASSIRSLLMSTLLQPSAIFLAMWYLIRLPIFLGPLGFGPECVKEIRFRAELLGSSEWHHAGQETLETQVPFRLVVLGCMLANKWLDDHTFSNKTWHTISNVPVQSLNRLENLALDIFAHDLSIPATTWSQWLNHIMLYHLSLSSSHPQPISRPTSNPHSIVKKTIEELIDVSAASNATEMCDDRSCLRLPPAPLFLGLEDRKRERSGYISAEAVSDGLEIDLDEDGPLREEYIPRRRISRTGSLRDVIKEGTLSHFYEKEQEWERALVPERALPPPAKWSPEADEPILRNTGRGQVQYMAVRPSVMPPPAPLLAPVQSYRAAMPQGFPTWSTTTDNQADMKLQLPPPYALLSYGDYTHHNVGPTHSRSASLSHGHHVVLQPPSHVRSHSQSQFEHACSDLRFTAQKASQPIYSDLHWPSSGHQVYGSAIGRDFTHHPGMQQSSAWLRA